MASNPGAASAASSSRLRTESRGRGGFSEAGGSEVDARNLPLEILATLAVFIPGHIQLVALAG